MVLSYTFSNICGATFEGGQVAFTPDGDVLAAPTSNRVTVHDLRQNRAQTLPFEARQTIQHVIFSPVEPLLLTIDESGRCLIVNFIKSIVLSRTWFRAPVADAKFSPCGQYFVVAVGRRLKIWDAPSIENGWQCSLRREIQHHADRIVTVNWSSNSEFLCTASRDLTVRIFSRDPIEGFSVTTFVDHRHPLRGAFFSHDMTRVYSIATDGTVISWKWLEGLKGDANESEDFMWDDEDEEGRKNRGFHLQSNRQRCSSRPGPILGTSIHRHLRSKRLRTRDESSEELHQTESDGTSPETAKRPRFVTGKWILDKKIFCNQAAGALVSRVAFHSANGLLVVGFSNGVLGLYECPEFSALYTLSIGTAPLDSVAINSDGEWLGIGSSQLGQLVVWEWRSETYILKQQSHGTGVRCVACSPTLDMVSQNRLGGDRTAVSSLGLGQRSLAVATGGEDGKLKLWDSVSGFNYMTFTEHIAPINDVVFTPQGNAVISASDDGSVRAFDMARYRNFRTFTSQKDGVQFSCVAVDGGGEVVVAGSQGAEYSVFVWSIQTGKLLEVLSGHEACVSSVKFHPHPSKPGTLVSGSWDGTLRVWDVFGRSGKGGASEPLVNSTGVLSVAFDPRGNNQLAASTLSGNIWFWDIQEGVMLGSIDGLRDIHSGRRIADKFSANNTRAAITRKGKGAGSVGSGVNQNQHFTSLVYSSNGGWLLAAAKTSARVCIYCSDTRSLLYTVPLTRNMSLDGILMELNSKWMMESGVAFQELDLSDSDTDEIVRKEKRIQQHKALPGVRSGEFKTALARKEFKIWMITFSQDGQQWNAATSHGLFTFAVDAKSCTAVSARAVGVYGGSTQSQLNSFLPNVMTQNVSPKSIVQALSCHPAKAMLLALALNDFTWLTRVYTAIPYTAIPVVVQSIPPLFIPALLNFLRICFSDVVAPQSTYTTAKGIKMMQRECKFGGSPHVQYHLRWLTCLLSSHLSVLQHIDPHSSVSFESQHSTGIDESPDHKERTKIMNDFGISQGDLCNLCLLLLRNVQRLHANLSVSFGSNLRTLDFLLVSKRRALPVKAPA